VDACIVSEDCGTRACHYFSTLLPFSLHQHSYYAFLIHNSIWKCMILSIEIIRTILFAHPNEKTRSKARKKPHLFLQKLLNFHYFLSFSLHLLYSYAFQMYLCIQKRISYQTKPQIYQICIITGEKAF
jgi:hypothetical protein